MELTTILYEKAGGIARLTLNRPEVMNAMNTRLRSELFTAVDAARADPEVGVLLITGAGGRAFSAGMDLKEFATGTATTAPTETRHTRWDKPHPLQLFDKPAIAVVNGLAIGGGLELALLCDIIVASDNASFALAEVKRGIIPGNGGTQRLARRIGKGKATELILTGRAISAAEALALGLVEHVVAFDALMDKAESIAREIQANAPVAVRFAKDAINRGLDLPIDAAMKIEHDLSAFVYTTEDAREGPRAFAEKRAPQWKGR